MHTHTHTYTHIHTYTHTLLLLVYRRSRGYHWSRVEIPSHGTWITSNEGLSRQARRIGATLGTFMCSGGTQVRGSLTVQNQASVKSVGAQLLFAQTKRSGAHQRAKYKTKQKARTCIARRLFKRSFRKAWSTKILASSYFCFMNMARFINHNASEYTWKGTLGRRAAFSFCL